jgi:hypothetical protein
MIAAWTAEFWENPHFAGNHRNLNDLEWRSLNIMQIQLRINHRFISQAGLKCGVMIHQFRNTPLLQFSWIEEVII